MRKHERHAKGLFYWKSMKKISENKKRSLLLKSNGRCFYCGVVLTNDNFSVDHIHPKSKGGCNLASNLVSCCRQCNAGKGTKDLETFRLYLSIQKSQFAGKITAFKFSELTSLGANFGVLPTSVFYFEECHEPQFRY